MAPGVTTGDCGDLINGQGGDGVATRCVHLGDGDPGDELDGEQPSSEARGVTLRLGHER